MGVLRVRLNEAMKKSHLTLVALSLLVGCSDNSKSGGGEPFVGRYSSGKKEIEGYKLADGTKVGHWIGWYDSGQKRAEGEYKNGKEEGLWTVWHENGQKWFESEYKNGLREGRGTCWSNDGSIDYERSAIYKAGEKIADLPKK